MSKFFEEKAKRILDLWESEEIDDDLESTEHLQYLITEALKNVKEETIKYCASGVLCTPRHHGRIDAHLAAGICFDVKLEGEE